MTNQTTEKPKRSAMLKYLAILFAGAFLLVTLSFVVRQQAAAAETPEAHSASTEIAD